MMEYYFQPQDTVPEEVMEQVHTAGQQILDAFVEICARHSLRYYIVAGTLLGAVRHQGPIPWDDDIDVAMPRQDYERFKEILLKRPEGEEYHIHCYENDPNFRLFLLRLNKKGTVYSLHHESNVDLRFKELWIDIFPLDEAPSPAGGMYQLRGHLIAALKRMANNKVRVNGRELSIKGKLLHAMLVVVPYSCLRSWTERLMRVGEGKNRENYVGWASHYDFRKQTMPKSWYEPSCEVNYSGKMYSAPGKWKEMLGRLYGDYMQLPPKEKRVGHVPEHVKL